MNLDPKHAVIASIVSYSLCSGSLVLLNKLTLHFLPFPSLVVCIQLLACIAIIYGAMFMKFIDVDPIKLEYAKPYMLYIFFFCTGIYCNMRSLSISNVETVIVFRSLTPMVVAFLDALFLGREWPSKRSWVGLLTLVVGAVGYASFDEEFLTQGLKAYSWPTLYTIIIALEMAYGKKIVKEVPLQTRSGPVVYTNLIGFIPMLMLANVGDEYSRFWKFFWEDLEGHLPTASIVLLVLGSLVGTGIGYSGWWCRSLVSATSYTLIGVINKCLTVIVNSLIWDQHAKPGGIFCLFICIVGGLIYKQAPMRSLGKIEPPATVDDDIFKTSIESDVPSSEKDEEMASLMRKPNISKGI